MEQMGNYVYIKIFTQKHHSNTIRKEIKQRLHTTIAMENHA